MLQKSKVAKAKKQQFSSAVVKTRKKTPRKKWLPPLDPASTSSSSTTPKPSSDASQAWKEGEWLSSPELFSTLTTDLTHMR
jgi:hypothetical protein